MIDNQKYLPQPTLGQAADESLRVSPSRGLTDGLSPKTSPSDLYRAGVSSEQLKGFLVEYFCSSDELLSSNYPKYKNITSSELRGLARAARTLSRGCSWYVEPLRNLQPRSFRILSENSVQLIAGYDAFFDAAPPFCGAWAMLETYLVVRGRVFEFVDYHTPSPEVSGPQHFMAGSLPEVLVKSWWYRFAGLKLCRSIRGQIGDFAAPLLSYPGCGTAINKLIAELDPRFQQVCMSALTEVFGQEAVTKVYQTGRTAVVCFLDTRVPLAVPRTEGDQLLVRMDRSDQTVYHARACRFDQLRVLEPSTLAECFDRYFEHVLSRQPGEFDFLPYGRSL